MTSYVHTIKGTKRGETLSGIGETKLALTMSLFSGIWFQFYCCRTNLWWTTFWRIVSKTWALSMQEIIWSEVHSILMTLAFVLLVLAMHRKSTIWPESGVLGTLFSSLKLMHLNISKHWTRIRACYNWTSISLTSLSLLDFLYCHSSMHKVLIRYRTTLNVISKIW